MTDNIGIFIYLVLGIIGLAIVAGVAYFLKKGYGLKDFIVYSSSCILIYVIGIGLIYTGSFVGNLGSLIKFSGYIISFFGYLIVYILSCLIIFGIVSVLPGMNFHKNISAKKYYMLSAFTFIFIFIIWSFVSYVGSHEVRAGEFERGLINHIFLPTPSEVLNKAFLMLSKYEFYTNLWVSIYRIIIGFGLAVAVSIPLGILMGSFKPVEALFNPLFAFIRYMPPTAFISLLIIWSAIDDVPILLIFIGVFFYLLVLIMDHVANVPKELLETSYTLGANKLEVLTMVIYPSVLPGILDSSKAMIGAAWTYLIAAELVGGGKGVGYSIIKAQRFLNTSDVFVIILVIGLIGIITNAIFELAYRWLFPWKRAEK